ncbi:hypothetical protein ABFS83_03G025100 [Erythranthe nasuta]
MIFLDFRPLLWTVLIHMCCIKVGISSETPVSSRYGRLCFVSSLFYGAKLNVQVERWISFY